MDLFREFYEAWALDAVNLIVEEHVTIDQKISTSLYNLSETCVVRKLTL